MDHDVSASNRAICSWRTYNVNASLANPLPPSESRQFVCRAPPRADRGLCRAEKSALSEAPSPYRG